MESILAIISGLFETRLGSWVYVIAVFLSVVGLILLINVSSILVILISVLLILLGGLVLFLQMRKDYFTIKKANKK